MGSRTITDLVAARKSRRKRTTPLLVVEVRVIGGRGASCWEVRVILVEEVVCWDEYVGTSRDEYVGR